MKRYCLALMVIGVLGFIGGWSANTLYHRYKTPKPTKVVFTIQRSFDGKHWQDIKIHVTKDEGFQATTFVTNIPALMMRVKSVENE